MFMKISEYRETQFTKGSKPKIETLRKWINDGDLPGKVIGKQYYVEIDVVQPVNHYARKILGT